MSRDKRGLLVVTDIGGRVFEVDLWTEETRTLFASPVPSVLNDAVRTADGRVWVSLSTSGLLLDAILQPLPDGAIWRIDPTGGLRGNRYTYDGAQAVVVADRLMFANGLLLDDDETYLYWAETTGNVIMKAPIVPRGRLGSPVVFAQIPFGGDNLAMDVEGNVYFANDWLTGVWAVNPAGVVFPIIFTLRPRLDREESRDLAPAVSEVGREHLDLSALVAEKSQRPLESVGLGRRDAADVAVQVHTPPAIGQTLALSTRLT